MAAPPRIHQPRHRRGYPNGYHPDIPSDGLTLDTPLGPVDLIAVQRALTGHPTPLTRSDVAYAVSRIPDGNAEYVEPAAAGLGIDPAAVKRAVHRRTAVQRSGGVG